MIIPVGEGLGYSRYIIQYAYSLRRTGNADFIAK